MFDLFGFIRQLIGSMLAIFSFGKKKLSNSLSVYVKTNTGNTLAVDLEPHMDIKDVKEMVAPRLGLEPQELKIIFAGRELSDTTTISVSGGGGGELSYFPCFAWLHHAGFLTP